MVGIGVGVGAGTGVAEGVPMGRSVGNSVGNPVGDAVDVDVAADTAHALRTKAKAKISGPSQRNRFSFFVIGHLHLPSCAFWTR